MSESFYGLMMRPADINSVPGGLEKIVQPTELDFCHPVRALSEVHTSSYYRHGIAVYHRLLSQEEIEDYELIDFQNLRVLDSEPKRTKALVNLVDQMHNAIVAGEQLSKFIERVLEKDCRNPFYNPFLNCIDLQTMAEVIEDAIGTRASEIAQLIEQLWQVELNHVQH